jgi:zinc/manganese transport system substrate-binding protein/manganese/iron transport system substrate-binding protein
MMKQKAMFFTALMAVLWMACAPLKGNENGDLKVLATTSIIADVVRNVAGPNIEIFVLFPAGSDPHGFSPTPQDLVAIGQSDLIFFNGLGLEDSLSGFLAGASESAVVIALSEAIFLEDSADPHTWMDPKNVSNWVDRIAQELGAIDPSNIEEYKVNAAAYNVELDNLDQWMLSQFETIDVNKRVLLTDHEILTHFARSYDFEILGTLIVGTSTLSEASASSLADLERLIGQRKIPALFLGSPESEAMATQFAADTGLQLIPIFVESLSEADGFAPTYLELMRYDVKLITNALK